MTAASREKFLLGGLTLVVAALIGTPVDDVRYRRCIRAEAHRERAQAAFDDGRLLQARREAQRAVAECPRLVLALRDLEMSAMVGLRECTDVRDLARGADVEAPACDEADHSDLAKAGRAALARGDQREARRLFEGALGVKPNFSAGERIELTGTLTRFGDLVLACINGGVALVDLKTEVPRLVKRPGAGSGECLLSPTTMHAYINGHMVDVVNNVDLWTADGRGYAFSSDGMSFLDDANHTLRLRDARSGEVRRTFDSEGSWRTHAIGRTLQWLDESSGRVARERHFQWAVLDVDRQSLETTAFVDATTPLQDARHRVVVDAARSAIVMTNLATHAEIVIPSKVEKIDRIALVSNGGTLITHSFSSTRSFDVTTGEELLIDGFGRGRRAEDAVTDVFAWRDGSSIFVGKAPASHEIPIEDVQLKTAEQGLSLLRSIVPTITIPGDVESKLVVDHLLLTRGVRELSIRFFARGRMFIESTGLFDVVGDVPVKCFAYGEFVPLPSEACESRRTPGLLATFLAQ